MEFFKTYSDDMHHDNNLLQTIRIPKNLLFLTDRLPQANYSTNQKKINDDNKKKKLVEKENIINIEKKDKKTGDKEKKSLKQILIDNDGAEISEDKKENNISKHHKDKSPDKENSEERENEKEKEKLDREKQKEKEREREKDRQREKEREKEKKEDKDRRNNNVNKIYQINNNSNNDGLPNINKNNYQL